MIRQMRSRPADDAGVTLTELLVSMAIFTVVLAVFFGGLTTMTRSTVRSQDVTDAGDSLRRAFQTMDRQIRYASSINAPGAGSSGAHYVEFITTAVPAGLDPLCTQWRFDPTARTLAVRTWRDTSGATASMWSVAATEVRNDLDDPDQQPFELVPAGTSLARQQLTVRLDSGRGSPEPEGAPGADFSTVFVARNSSHASPSNVLVGGQSETPVCSDLLERP